MKKFIFFFIFLFLSLGQIAADGVSECVFSSKDLPCMQEADLELLWATGTMYEPAVRELLAGVYGDGAFVPKTVSYTTQKGTYLFNVENSSGLRSSYVPQGEEGTVGTLFLGYDFHPAAGLVAHHIALLDFANELSVNTYVVPEALALQLYTLSSERFSDSPTTDLVVLEAKLNDLAVTFEGNTEVGLWTIKVGERNLYVGLIPGKVASENSYPCWLDVCLEMRSEE